jgi:hypothetical protein
VYTVDGRDRVVELTAVPQSSVGAPLPLVLSDDSTTVLAYLLEDSDPEWDGKTIRPVTPESEEPAALIRFHLCRALYFGSPNDETLAGHPLYARGLGYYGAYEVLESSWIRALERMDRVHPSHNPARFRQLRHFIWAFHDSTFECIAERYDASVHPRPLSSLLPEMQRRLGSSGAAA